MEAPVLRRNTPVQPTRRCLSRGGALGGYNLRGRGESRRGWMAEKTEITWDPEADRRIKRSPFLMRRFIRKRIEDRVAGRGRTHVTEADVDERSEERRVGKECRS